MEVTKVTTEEWKNYLDAVNRLKSRIGGTYQGILIEDHIRFFRDFYNQLQTSVTRHGIIDFLDEIEDILTFKFFLKIQKELLKISFKIELERDGESFYTFFYFVEVNPFRAIDLAAYVFHFYQNWLEQTSEVIKNMMVIGENVTGNPELTIPDQKKLISLLFSRMYYYFESNKWIKSELIEKLGNPNFSLLPTSGDLHCNGKNPYIVIEGEKKIVYKPRDMRVDFCVVEVLKELQKIFPKELKLPFAEVNTFDDFTGYMKYVEHKEEMSIKEAEQYFKKLGALFYICKLFGIHDLHQENIMATEEGPVLIDMECAFGMNIIVDKNFDELHIVYIKLAYNKERFANSTFYVNNGKTRKIPKFNDKLVKDNIIYGFNQASDFGKQNRGQLIQIYQWIMGQKFFIRLVPIATIEFYQQMYDYYINTAAENASMLRTCTEIIVKTIEANYSYFLPAGSNAAEEIDRGLLCNAVKKALFQGDIPMLQLKYDGESQGEVYIDHKLFMKLKAGIQDKARLEKEFAEQIEWLAGEEAKRKFEKLLFDK